MLFSCKPTEEKRECLFWPSPLRLPMTRRPAGAGPADTLNSHFLVKNAWFYQENQEEKLWSNSVFVWCILNLIVYIIWFNVWYVQIYTYIIYYYDVLNIYIIWEVELTWQGCRKKRGWGRSWQNGWSGGTQECSGRNESYRNNASLLIGTQCWNLITSKTNPQHTWKQCCNPSWQGQRGWSCRCEERRGQVSSR